MFKFCLKVGFVIGQQRTYGPGLSLISVARSMTGRCAIDSMMMSDAWIVYKELIVKIIVRISRAGPDVRDGIRQT